MGQTQMFPSNNFSVFTDELILTNFRIHSQDNFCHTMSAFQWVVALVLNIICLKFTTTIRMQREVNKPHDLCNVKNFKFFFPFKNIQVVDHSGFRIHYTRRLREYDGGMMITGVSVSDTQMIPPQQKLYRNVGICGTSCTKSVSYNTM